MHDHVKRRSISAVNLVDLDRCGAFPPRRAPSMANANLPRVAPEQNHPVRRWWRSSARTCHGQHRNLPARNAAGCPRAEGVYPPRNLGRRCGPMGPGCGPQVMILLLKICGGGGPRAVVWAYVGGAQSDAAPRWCDRERTKKVWGLFCNYRIFG